MAEEITLLKLEKKHIKPVSIMLSRAFKDDPLTVYVFPNLEDRIKKMAYADEFYLRYELSNCKAFVTSPKLEGIAVWVHSDKLKRKSFWRILTFGAICLSLKIGIKALKKMQVIELYSKLKHKELVSTKHWYLMLLGVDPEHQGKGYASRLLNEMLSHIDEEGLPCYLETNGEKNVSIYKHFGFEVIDESITPGTNHKMVAMLRKPKTIKM